MKHLYTVHLIFLAGMLLSLPAHAADQTPPLVFPIPQQLEERGRAFDFERTATIFVPEEPSAADLSLARLLVADLSDRHGIAITVERTAAVPPGRRAIVMGAADNELVASELARRGLVRTSKPESYHLQVGADSILVAGADDRGAFYGLQSLRQLVRAEGGAPHAPGVKIVDHPHLPFRAIRLYLPGPENIAFFKRFLRDFMALYKFNQVIVEVNASMRLRRHPELNAGWVEFAKDLHYTQRYYPLGPNDAPQNSAHHDAADGRILEQEEVADLVDYARRLHIDVIPEIPTLTHSYYLLTRHKQFSAVKGAEWPDTYCPTDPGIYDLVFDVMDEYIAVMRPRMIHIGHDELFYPIELCRCCGETTPQELFAQDVQALHRHLTTKGIKVAMYGDHLIESVRGAGRKPAKSRSGWAYHTPGALSPEQVRDLIPKDILIFNWFWQDVRAHEGNGEPNDLKLIDFGFEQAYMNFTQWIENWDRRSVRPGVIGGAPAAWAATTEYSFGKDMLVTFLSTANLMWSTHWPDHVSWPRTVQAMVPEIRRRLSGRSTPSADGNPVVPVPLAPVPAAADFNVDLSALPSGRVATGSRRFEIVPSAVQLVGTARRADDPRPRVSRAIPVGADVSSLLFLHACTTPAMNDMSYRTIHNVPDTADLLGWYEVVYEDGFVENVPIRYGVNILPLDWGVKPELLKRGYAIGQPYAYEADVIDCGPHSLFAYEWVNPRFGRPLKEIRLRGTTGYKDARGNLAPENTIVLAGLSAVTMRRASKVVDTVE